MLYHKVKIFHLLWGARGKWADRHDFHSPLRALWTPFNPTKEVLGMMKPWNCVMTTNTVTSTQFETHGNWDVFPTQVIYENWDTDEPNNHEEIEHCAMFNRSPQMRWNDLYCEHLLNWICETKKGMISSLFNWSDKYKFKGKLYGFQPIERKKYIWYFSFEC